jgi:excisionase family DNA binding protein
MRPTPTRQDRLLTTAQAAAALGVHERTLRRYLASGLLTYRRLPGGHYRISESSIERFWLDSNRASPPRRAEQTAQRSSGGQARGRLHGKDQRRAVMGNHGAAEPYDLSPMALAQLRARLS